MVSRPPNLKIAARRASCGFIPAFSYSAANKSRCDSNSSLKSSSISAFDQMARTFAHKTRTASPITHILLQPYPQPRSRIRPNLCRSAAPLRPMSARFPNLGMVGFCLSPSLAFLGGSEEPRDYGGKLLPILSGLRQPLRSPRSDRIKLRLPFVFGDAPLRLDQPSLLQTHQRRVDRPLIQQDSVPADLLDAPRNAVPM